MSCSYWKITQSWTLLPNSHQLAAFLGSIQIYPSVGEGNWVAILIFQTPFSCAVKPVLTACDYLPAAKPDTLTLLFVSHGGGDYQGMKGTVPVLALVRGAAVVCFLKYSALRQELSCWEGTFWGKLQFIPAGNKL